MSYKFKDKNVREPIVGFRDIIGLEVRLKTYVSNKIGELFQRWGYDQIIFPLVERASSFSEEIVGGSPWPEWDKRSVFYFNVRDYKDSYKELSIKNPALLIPEGTISVSRWLAKQLVSNKREGDLFPMKVFYITPCFRNELTSKVSATKGREFNQVGVEILGTSSLLADIEVLFLVYEGLISINIPKDALTIRVGSVEIYNSLCAESKVDRQTRIYFKNSLDIIAESRAGKAPVRLKPEIEKIMKAVHKMKLSEKLTKKWGILCNTYTKSIDINTAKILGYQKPIEELNKLAFALQDSGIKCFIDPSVVRSHEYYTGIVYEIDLKIGNKVFVEVAGGGRYNKLIGKFLAGKEYQIPAVGFAYGLERLVEFFKLMGKDNKSIHAVNYWTKSNGIDEVLYSKPQKSDDIINLFRFAEKLRGRNDRVSVYVGDGNKKKALEYSKKHGARFSIK
jgi:histidyl-tRNA synthetase